MPAGDWERIAPHTARAARHTEPRQIDAFRRWLDLDARQLLDLLADPVFTVTSGKRFDDLPVGCAMSAEDKGADAAHRLIAAGLDPLILDFSPLRAEMHAVRVIVPRLEVEGTIVGPR